MNTCETCKWWKPPTARPTGWGGHINEYGACRHFANDRLLYLPGTASTIRCADEKRAPSWPPINYGHKILT